MMRLPLLTAMILVFILWLQYEIRKVNHIAKKRSESFWQKETQANNTRRADISELNYITVALDQLPMAEHSDSTVNSYRDTIRKLSDNKIVNLSGLTNTDLKLKYGVANYNQLAEYDNNYTILVSMLQKWAERLYHLGDIASSILVLEYAVSCYTEVEKTYLLIATIYKEQGNTDKIKHIINLIPDTKIKDKSKLIKKLETIINS